jgi:hypothetical protein
MKSHRTNRTRKCFRPVVESLEGRCLPSQASPNVDAAGARSLRDLMREGIKIAACSSFIGELLHLEAS